MPPSTPEPPVASSDDEAARYEKQLTEFLDSEIDEERFASEIAASRRRRRWVFAGLGIVAVALVAWVLLRGDDGPDSSGFVFEDEAIAEPSRALEVPTVVDARLVSRLDLPVVVRAGNAEEFERIVPNPSSRVLPARPGDLVVGLARAGDEGRVVLTGPEGWMEGACVMASITSGLVPVDIVHWEGVGGCDLELAGQPAVEWCRGEQTVVFAIDVPQGSIDLATGDQGVAEALRVQLVHEIPGFETASVRGRVDVEDLTVDVPVLSGPSGAEASFELGGAGARVSCIFV
ncbi:MAG: hypothetical protein ACR2QE_01525 [Acidimicrobiales bacterium]